MVLLAVVVVSYRQVVRAYPSGRGSYEVATKNLGRSAGLVVAAALLVDYVMTVAVSVAAGVDNIISAVPALNPLRVEVNIAFVLFLMAMNLRGVRESGKTFAVPTYVFIAGVIVMIAVGLGQAAMGTPPVAESAGWQVRPEQVGLTALAVAFLTLRAFASGCTALTGVEAICPCTSSSYEWRPRAGRQDQGAGSMPRPGSGCGTPHFMGAAAAGRVRASG